MNYRNKLNRLLLKVAGICGFMVVMTILELVFLRLESATLAGKLLFLFLLNINILALLSLMYFVGKRIVWIVLERKKGVLGYTFRTRVVAFFVILISIPSAVLFVIASGLGTNYIDRFFTPQFRRPLETSLAIAQEFYDIERRRILQYAELAREGQVLPPQYQITFMDSPDENASAAVQAAFEGEHDAEVISSTEGDTIRAAIPLGPDDPRGNIMVVDTTLPREITRSIEQIQTSYEDYVQLEAWRFPIKLNYILLLGFFTLIIIFAGLWVSLKIASWITDPVRNLAFATEEVAKGNLNVNVTSSRRDEIGLLIESFNHMVREMRQDKDSLKKAYQNLENIVRNIQSGVISLDASGHVQDINTAACRILNIRAEDVLGKFYPELLRETRSPGLEELIKGINLKTFRELDRQVRATIEGRKMLLRVYITALKGFTGEHRGLLVVIDDLTDFVKAQRALAWQEVARRIAHEIKNPLTPIKLSTERMFKKWQERDPTFDGIFERSTKTIIREVDGLKRLVDEFARLGKMPEIVKEPTDISDVVNEVVTLYKDYKKLRIGVAFENGVQHADLDREQFKRVLINLFDNAREAMENEGNIEVIIRQEPESNRLQIDLADDGPGIPDEDKERLFLPYFSTKKDGTGLGLAIADRIVAEHGGNIRVRDNSPRGSIFTIEMPIKEA